MSIDNTRIRPFTRMRSRIAREARRLHMSREGLRRTNEPVDPLPSVRIGLEPRTSGVE